MDTKRSDGGPAFPTDKILDGDGFQKRVVGDNGMSLRDWFAGQTVAGMMAHSCRRTCDKEYAGYSSEKGDALAARAYKVADAMLKARGK